MTYYGFLALVPLLGIIVMLYGLLAEPETVVDNVRTLTTILPPDVAKLIAEQLIAAVQTTRETKGVGILVALLVALYGGTNGAGAIMTALNIAYQEKEKRTLGRFYLGATRDDRDRDVRRGAGAGRHDDAGAAWQPRARGVAAGADGRQGRRLFGLSVAAAAIAATLYRFAPVARGCALDAGSRPGRCSRRCPGCC